MSSHIIEMVVNSWYRLDRVQSIELKSSPIECLCKVTIARVILLLYLYITWSTITIVHVVCSINWRTNIHSVLGVLWVTVCCMEFCFLLVSHILRVRVHSFSLKSLSDHLLLYESLCSFEIVERINNFWIGWHFVSFNVSSLSADVVLNPRWAILLTVSLVKVIFGTESEWVAACLSHFIYNFWKLLEKAIK